MEFNNTFIGIDIGSTTVKVVVVAETSKSILWSKYQRHETRQAECVLSMLEEVLEVYPELPSVCSGVFITGSGAGPLEKHLNAKFVQEVNAVTFAVEQLHPEVNSVIELGGQDAKIIMFKENEQTGDKRSIASMNDKCASGTGATIDKCMIKVGMSQDEIARLKFNPEKLHHVAAKCGVFAETDIVNLVKSGIPADEIMNSLADAIVGQNLSVLTRGNTLKCNVLLLGGPNTYLKFLQECWRYRIPQTWEERGYEFPKEIPLDQLIFTPDNAEFYAAYGAVLYGMEDGYRSVFSGFDKLREFIAVGRHAQLGANAGPPLTEGEQQVQQFVSRYKLPEFKPALKLAESVIKGYIGLDGGSTSSKCVLIAENGEIIQKVYRLSEGNPLEDMKFMFSKIQKWASENHFKLEVLGFGVTGYAGDVLEVALQADANIVETVAHMKSAQHYFPDVDVICDVGGQDIKVLFMQNQMIKNFKLSNSCSAGNGMLLQAMADQFGIEVEQYAESAFEANLSPVFSYGCAVFLDSDRVNFQKEGYNSKELLAGLALVLPKNIWQYIVQVPRMAELGRVFVLQGGTQKNLAAVKAQVDYIEQRVPDAEIHVHPHTGEAGALGAAFEAMRVVERKGKSNFIGLEAAINLSYTTKNDESTRCDFCENNCSRTFIDTVTPENEIARYISGFSCEKGTVEDYDALRVLNKQRRDLMKAYPNLVNYEAKLNFRPFFKTEVLPESGMAIEDIKSRRTLFGAYKHTTFFRGFLRSSEQAQKKRSEIRIGIPKALNIWGTAPFWRAYFETLGLRSRNIVFSDDTSEELWQAGGKYGSVDPCYPAKVVQAHIHNLLFVHHEKKPLNYIFFPSLTHIPTFVEKVMDSACCPIVAGTPNVMRASFTKETDFFAQRNITYLDPIVALNEPLFLKQKMFEQFSELLDITEDESNFAIEQAFKALEAFDKTMQEKGKAILDQVVAENRMALLMIGRPYHNDPGINHDVLEEYQAMGYPILSIRSIPKDKAYLESYFREDMARGVIGSPLEIEDVWPENYSANSVQKVWAAKFAARHPNVAVLDLSSFKCGHDAPTYGMIDSICSATATPYSALHDIDATKPTGSINIRVKTYGYTLTLEGEKLEDEHNRQIEFEMSVIHKRLAILQNAPEAIKNDRKIVAEIKKLERQLEQLKTAKDCIKSPESNELLLDEEQSSLIDVVEIS